MPIYKLRYINVIDFINFPFVCFNLTFLFLTDFIQFCFVFLLDFDQTNWFEAWHADSQQVSQYVVSLTVYVCPCD